MSRAAIGDQFLKETQQFLAENDLLNDPSRIYNIDESWFDLKDEKKQKVVVEKQSKMPYKIVTGVKEHVTFALCACANGDLLPPLFIYKNTLPVTDDFYQHGPQNAAYIATESGHINSYVYLKYIEHLEPFLNPIRPVVIFQDNLIAHENLNLIQFCIEHGIHLHNFPAKSSHRLQPLDKLFGPFKHHFQ